MFRTSCLRTHIHHHHLQSKSLGQSSKSSYIHIHHHYLQSHLSRKYLNHSQNTSGTLIAHPHFTLCNFQIAPCTIVILWLLNTVVQTTTDTFEKKQTQHRMDVSVFKHWSHGHTYLITLYQSLCCLHHAALTTNEALL